MIKEIAEKYYQKELINKIFEKWGNNKYIYTRL